MIYVFHYLDNQITTWLLQNVSYIKKLYNISENDNVSEIYSAGRLVKDGASYISTLKRQYNPNISSKTGIINENGEYYPNIIGNSNRASERQQKWKDLDIEFEKFYNYLNQLRTMRPTKPTISMISGTTPEIYEPECVYQVHYATLDEENDVVVGLSVKGESVKRGQDDSATFINLLLEKIMPDIERYLGLEVAEEGKKWRATVEDFAAYVKPVDDTPETVEVSERTKLIEYSQMLNTIQGQRDYIQKSGKSKERVLLKFMQNEKGTYFEILGKEEDNYGEKEQVYGYYISQGYGYEGGDGQIVNKPVVPPRGDRYSRRTQSIQMRGGEHKAVPDMSTGRFRITRMKEFYSQEPLDWRNDNYYSNQIYTLNADNLNTVVEPEFASRVKVITTKPYTPTGEEDTKPAKYAEQEMIGFYGVKIEQVAVPTP